MQLIIACMNVVKMHVDNKCVRKWELLNNCYQVNQLGNHFYVTVDLFNQKLTR